MNHDYDIRYARQISLPEIGKNGQDKLRAARILQIGAGGLGSPLALYLAGAGIGTLGIIDHDRVSLSNLHRQILFETGDIGRLKVDAAEDRLLELNPDIQLITYPTKLTTDNATEIFQNYDLIVDGCDDLTTRYLVNDGCMTLKKPLISGAVIGFSGQLYHFAPHLGKDYPCYRCLYPSIAADAIPSCKDAGVTGPGAGIVAGWMAMEVIKTLTNCGTLLHRSMMIIDMLTGESRQISLPRDPACQHTSP